MKMKIFCFIVSTLLITVTIISTSATIDDNSSIENNTSYDDLIDYASDNNRFSNNWSEQSKLTALDGEPNENFGFDVFTNGNQAIIGTDYNDNIGAAYVFKRNGTVWTEEAKLLPSDGVPGDYFGSSASINENYAIVGAPNDFNANGNDAGSAYIFKKTDVGWVEEQKLIASDGAKYDYFGRDVSIIGDYAFINVWTMNYYGAVYIFKNTGPTWVEHQKLVSSDVEKGDFFGRSFSFCGDYAIIGAVGDDNYYGENAGAAYIFKKTGTTWVEEQKLVVSDARGSFGYSVSMSGDYAVVGAIHDPYTDVGAVYIFKNTGTSWIEEQKVNASDGEIEDWFCHEVAISEGNIVVSAPGDDNYTGSAYLYKNTGTTWVEDQKLIASDNISYDYFGNSVSISGPWIVVGAPGDDNINGENAGAAYIFKRTDAPELKIGTIKGGLFRVQSYIENIGILNATVAQWKIKLDGRVFIGKETTGTTDILTGGNIAIKSKLILGFGPIKVIVTADAPDAVSDSKQQNGFVLLFFINI